MERVQEGLEFWTNSSDFLMAVGSVGWWCYGGWLPVPV